MRVVVLTTSYPRFAGDAAGRFVAAAVAHVRQAGMDVEVVSPATFRHFGVAYGVGIVGNLLLLLTMQFYYFYAFIMLALSVPIVFGRRLARA